VYYINILYYRHDAYFYYIFLPFLQIIVVKTIFNFKYLSFSFCFCWYFCYYLFTKYFF